MIPGCLADLSGVIVLSTHALLALHHHIAPAALAVIAFLANAGIEDLHPTFLVSGGIGVEIDDFAVVEADSETFFNEHIAFLFLSKARLASLSASARRLFSGQCTTIINQLASICQIDGGSRLTS